MANLSCELFARAYPKQYMRIRYEDLTQLHPIGACLPGQRVLIEGRVEHTAIVRARRSMMVVVLFDGTGRITLRFFHFHQYNIIFSIYNFFVLR